MAKKKYRDGGAVARGNKASEYEAMDYEDFGTDYAPETSLRPRARPKVLRPRARPPELEALGRADRMRRLEESETQMYKDGGEVRGCRASQVTGKGFRGTF